MFCAATSEHHSPRICTANFRKAMTWLSLFRSQMLGLDSNHHKHWFPSHTRRNRHHVTVIRKVGFFEWNDWLPSFVIVWRESCGYAANYAQQMHQTNDSVQLDDKRALTLSAPAKIIMTLRWVSCASSLPKTAVNFDDGRLLIATLHFHDLITTTWRFPLHLSFTDSLDRCNAWTRANTLWRVATAYGQLAC